MRVISQDGTVDLPYERIVISLENSGKDYCLLAFSDCTTIGLVIARYSTEENAKKAIMEQSALVSADAEEYMKRYWDEADK